MIYVTSFMLRPIHIVLFRFLSIVKYWDVNIFNNNLFTKAQTHSYKIRSNWYYMLSPMGPNLIKLFFLNFERVRDLLHIIVYIMLSIFILYTSLCLINNWHCRFVFLNAKFQTLYHKSLSSWHHKLFILGNWKCTAELICWCQATSVTRQFVQCVCSAVVQCECWTWARLAMHKQAWPLLDPAVNSSSITRSTMQRQENANLFVVVFFYSKLNLHFTEMGQLFLKPRSTYMY